GRLVLWRGAGGGRGAQSAPRPRLTGAPRATDGAFSWPLRPSGTTDGGYHEHRYREHPTAAALWRAGASARLDHTCARAGGLRCDLRAHRAAQSALGHVAAALREPGADPQMDR